MRGLVGMLRRFFFSRLPPFFLSTLTYVRVELPAGDDPEGQEEAFQLKGNKYSSSPFLDRNSQLQEESDDRLSLSGKDGKVYL